MRGSPNGSSMRRMLATSSAKAAPRRRSPQVGFPAMRKRALRPCSRMRSVPTAVSVRRSHFGHDWRGNPQANHHSLAWRSGGARPAMFLLPRPQAIASIDLFVVPTLTFERLFAFLVLGHGRRQLLWFEVTRHPTAAWLARQITEAFPWASAPAYVVRDNDRAYGHVFTSRVRAMGIRDRPISPRSPWQNPYVERLIGTIRRECLDQVLVFGEAHLRQILSSYAAYYNEVRTHLALGKDAPLGRAVQRTGVVVAIPILSGLHHHYVRK